jgi:TRAP transporter 4TM/12TM fusion protein
MQSVDVERGSKEAEQLETPRFSVPEGWARWVVVVLAVAFSSFQLYTAAFGVLEQFLQRSIHVAFAFALIALTYRAGWLGRPASRRAGVLDWLLLVAGVFAALHVVLAYKRLMNRIAYVDPLQPIDLVASLLLVLVTLEMCRRVIGGGLSLVAAVFIVYGLFGNAIPGTFGHPGMSPEEFLETMYLSGEGIFGIPIGVSATYVFVFVLFGAFIMRLGLMNLFVDLSMAVAGSTAGGPAKVAIICSALFGTISGSGIANAITTGSFTVPLMKQVGYRAHFAAGVESAASMGGNIMPPIMGAAAFIMADFLGVPYVQVALAAFVPAVLYFVGIGTMVHYEALKRGLARLPRDQLPSARASLRARGHLLIPVIGLVYFLVDGWSVMFAGVVGIALSFLVSFLRAETRITPRRLVEILEWSALTALPVVAACAVVGIIIGVIAQTGLGVKITSLILSFAAGNLFLTLAMAMAASLVLGLGLPTTPTYIITAALTAPALIQFGVPPIAAHLFVFYFGILADITPPTAIAPFAVASIANADPNRTCFAACMLALSGFIVPFVFAFEPAMLDPLLSKPDTTLWAFLTVSASAFVGIAMLSAALIGWLRTSATVVERLMLFAGAMLLIFPGAITDLTGLALGALVFAVQGRRLRTAAQPDPASRSSP